MIPAGVTGIVDHEYSGAYEWIRVDGTLEFDPSVDTELRVVTLVATPGSTVQISPQYNRTAVISIPARGERDREQ